jgi:hypothetical protein
MFEDQAGDVFAVWQLSQSAILSLATQLAAISAKGKAVERAKSDAGETPRANSVRH